MKVGIYHPFGSFPDNYSLSHVVREQMLMLVEGGIDVYFITAEWFEGEVPEGVTVCNVLPRSKTEKIAEASDFIVEEMDYVFTHDILYLDSYKKHDNAIRAQAEKYPNIKWLHWSYSAPNTGDKRKPMPNSIYIGMNYTDLQLLAEQFQVPVAQCRVVYNARSPDVYHRWHPFTKKLVDKHDLLSCDILVVYPFDTGRWEAKGGPKIMKLVEKLRKLGQNAKVVFINAAANDGGRRKLVEKWAKKGEDYAVFTSLENKSYEVCVPHRIVEELQQIANVFPLLSVSEGCSLIMLEAALSGQLVILNEDFPPMREFGETDLVLYMKTSSSRCTTTYNPSEDAYYEDWAQTLIEELERNKALRFKRKILQKFNRRWIWKNQLEPLLG